MIKAIFILSSNGKLRLMRLYETLIPESKEDLLIKELYGKAVERRKNSSGFLIEKTVLKDNYTIVCRHCYGLFFIAITDEYENELALLDFIHIFAQILDKMFAGVGELDILYNPEKINYILDELIVDGNVVQTSLKEAVDALHTQAKMEALG